MMETPQILLSFLGAHTAPGAKRPACAQSVRNQAGPATCSSFIVLKAVAAVPCTHETPTPHTAEPAL
eukprot:411604-Pelagomonas_calceolata.AAC.1